MKPKILVYHPDGSIGHSKWSKLSFTFDLSDSYKKCLAMADVYFHMQNRGGAFAEWNFLRGQEEGWIPKIPSPDTSSIDLYGTCYDIIFRTKDDESIVHEFPDPKSLDPNNWQGFNIDDDVVVTHGQSLSLDLDGNWYDPNDRTNGQYSMVSAIGVVSSVLCFVGLVRMMLRRFLKNQNQYQVIGDDLKY